MTNRIKPARPPETLKDLANALAIAIFLHELPSDDGGEGPLHDAGFVEFMTMKLAERAEELHATEDELSDAIQSGADWLKMARTKILERN